MNVPGHKLSPGNNSDDRKIDSQVDDGHCNHAYDDRARNGPARIFHFVADVTDVVIAQIVVNTDARGGAKAKEKAKRETESARREVECSRRAEMHYSGYYHRQR